MIELPGSFSGMLISPIPDLGPLASHLISFAIFIILAASPFSAPLKNTSASWLVRPWNLFGCETKAYFVLVCLFS